jgi:adenylate cyclase
MSDLRGFTAISARLDPMQLIHLLNNYFEKMVEIIEKYSGTVIEFLGDGIFVVFGAPADDPLHPSHAVHCAVEMQNKMAEVNAWNRDEGLPELEMGIGIHSGLSVVGNIGSIQKMKYGCIGETVNLAGRIESLTIGGQVLISSSVRDRITEHLRIGSKQTFMPKGSQSDIIVLEVTAIGSTVLTQSEDPGFPHEIAPPWPQLQFSLLNGKTVEMVTYEGVLTAFSGDHRFLWLKTAAELRLRRNVLLKVGNGLYAKILSRDKDTYILCLTPKPDNLEELLRSLS